MNTYRSLIAKIPLLFMLFLVPTILFSQEEIWINVDNPITQYPFQNISTITEDLDGNIWLATSDCNEPGCAYQIMRFDGKEWHTEKTIPIGFVSPFYTTVGVISSVVNPITGDMWFGGDYLWKYDGINWTTYEMHHYPSWMDFYFIKELTVDRWGMLYATNFSVTCPCCSIRGFTSKFIDNKWQLLESNCLSCRISTFLIDHKNEYWFGCGKYCGIRHVVQNKCYQTSNETNSLFDIKINISSIFEDKDSTIWVCSNKGLLYKKDNKWNIYTSANSGLPSNNISMITEDKLGVKWIATDSGIVKFYEREWTVFNTSNSGLPGNKTGNVIIDSRGNIWTVVRDGWNPAGLAICQYCAPPSDTLVVGNEYEIETSIYPNPFSSITTIAYQITSESHVTIKIYNTQGSELAVVVDEPKSPGYYENTFDGIQLPTGVYLYKIVADDRVQIGKLVVAR